MATPMAKKDCPMAARAPSQVNFDKSGFRKKLKPSDTPGKVKALTIKTTNMAITNKNLRHRPRAASLLHFFLSYGVISDDDILKFNRFFGQQHPGGATIGAGCVAVERHFAGCAHVIAP